MFDGIRAVRNRQYFRKVFATYQRAMRERLYPANDSIMVQSGPFQGMRYLDEIVWGSITPKWLGSYEAELHPIIATIVTCAYSTIIDVGCAEGYYAVGLASALPQARIIAFDTDYISRRQLRRLATLNNVADNLEIRSYCRHADLESLSAVLTLVICDIEGFEANLLEPAEAPSLYRSDILVEVHESPSSSTEMERLLISRFESSHHISRIEAVRRDSWLEQNEIAVEKLNDSERLEATEEGRVTGRVWLWMQVNKREAAVGLDRSNSP